MKHSASIALMVGAMILNASSISWAADPKEGDQQREQLMQEYMSQMGKKQVYGWELMTPEEREQHREKIRNMSSQEERMAYIQQHHDMMRERARERGVSIPEKPLHRRMSRMHGGYGGGMGPVGGGKTPQKGMGNPQR